MGPNHQLIPHSIQPSFFSTTVLRGFPERSRSLGSEWGPIPPQIRAGEDRRNAQRGLKDRERLEVRDGQFFGGRLVFCFCFSFWGGGGLEKDGFV